jgi:YesN/AraC family two-component response regulator
VEPQRILIIDDDPWLVESLSAALCPPYRVLSARDGKAAFSVVRTQRIDLIVLDLRLGPDEDGLDLLPRLRALTPAPILLLTAFGTHENLVRIVRAKPDDFLEKPLGLQELRSRVAALLQGTAPETDPVERVRTCIEREYQRPLTGEALARSVKLSPAHLRRAFERRFGLSPAAYLEQCRMRRAAGLLYATQQLIKEIAARVGYPNANNFATAFKRFHGLSPRAYRAQPQPPEHRISPPPA